MLGPEAGDRVGTRAGACARMPHFTASGDTYLVACVLCAHGWCDCLACASRQSHCCPIWNGGPIWRKHLGAYSGLA
jgi:hypothetical protein